MFGTKALTLCEELSARLDYDTVEGTARSGPRFWRVVRRDRLTRTETDQRRDLLLPQEIARLKPRDAILLRPGMYPIRARRICHFANPTFTRLLRPVPEVPAIDVPVRLDQGKGFEPIAAKAAAGAPLPARPTGNRRTKEAADQAGSDDTEASGTDGRPPPPADRATSPLPSEPVLRPRQADGLIDTILGTDVDLSGYTVKDAKAVVAAILDAVPTSEPPGHSHGAADKSPGATIPSPAHKRWDV